MSTGASAQSAVTNNNTAKTRLQSQRYHYVTQAFLEVSDDVPPPLPKSKPPPIGATSTPLNGIPTDSNLTFSPDFIFEDDGRTDGSPILNHSDLLEQLAQQKEKVRQLEKRLSECERNNSSLTAENERMVTSFENAKKNEKEFEQCMLIMEQETMDLRRERDELQETVITNESVLNESRSQMRDLQLELNSMQKEMEEYEARVSEMTQRNEEMHKKLIDADQLTQSLRQELEIHKTSEEKYLELFTSTLKELEQVKLVKNDLNSELDYVKDENRRYNITNDNLKRQLAVFTSSSPVNKTFVLNGDGLQEKNSLEFMDVDCSLFMEEEPTSLGEEIQALRDCGTLPLGVESIDTDCHSVIDYVLRIMKERCLMAEQQCHELEPRILSNPQVLATNENRDALINLIVATQEAEEQLSHLLQKIVSTDHKGEQPCVLLAALLHMKDSLHLATESLTERMGGLDVQLTQSTPVTEGEALLPPSVPSVTPGPDSSVAADGSMSLQQQSDERACSEASWGRSTLGGGSGINALHPAPLRDTSIEGSDAISCAGSQLERDTCNHVTPERIKCQVHRELAALQSQINKSLEVLAALARSSDLLSVLKEYPISEHNQPDAVSATSGHQLAKSCPTLATQLSAATQTEPPEEQPQENISVSASDVAEFGEPCPKRFRSSSFVAAIHAGDTPALIEEKENGEELEDEVIQVEVSTTVMEDPMESTAEYEMGHDLLDEFRLSRKLSVLHEEADEGTTETRHHTLAPPPYRSPPNPYQSRSFDSYLDPPIPRYRYSDPSRLLYGQGSFKRQTSDPTPTGAPPPYREPPTLGSRLMLVAQVHREESGLPCGPRSTSRPLQLPPTSPSPSPSLPTKAVHFDATSPKSPPYMTPPDGSPWTSPRASTSLEEPPPVVVSTRASALRASLRRRSRRVVEEHPSAGEGSLPASPEHPDEEQVQNSPSPTPQVCSNEEPGSPKSAVGFELQSDAQQPNSRLSRHRSSLTGLSSVIQRAAAVDLDENEETAPSVPQGAVAIPESISPVEGKSVAFPSIPDKFLRQMGLFRDSNASAESLTELDVENKFTRLSLAFKTDKLTLEHRLNIQQRQRDDAERNVAREISELRGKINRLQRLCQESETIEELSEVQHQVDILLQSTESVSRSAEMYGAVQQEERVSRAVDVILAHVENLRRVQSKEHAELEETRRLLHEASSDTGDELTSMRGIRLRSQQLQSAQANARRRASIAVLPRSASPADHRSSSSCSIMDPSRMRQSVRSLQESSVRRTSFGSQSQRTDSSANIDETTLRLRRGETCETQPTDNEQSNDVTVITGGPSLSNIDVSLLHDDEDISNLVRLDVSESEDELHDEMDWRENELRQRRIPSGSVSGLTQTLGDNFSPSRSFRSMIHKSWRKLRSLRWPWSPEQSVLMLRRGATAILLVLAAVTMLLVIVPVSVAVAYGTRIVCWNPLRIQVSEDAVYDIYGLKLLRHPPPV